MPHLLLVEDMPDALGAFVVALRLAGYSVVGATDPRRAVECYREQFQNGTPLAI